ncbi:extracellular solute-binding protein [Isoptericola sp. NPDC057191]|uniref:extracellular solute-binding protein n=1 Tax=Isoptericola sp. NPDC057191 TaxID=3346041 RepID=UPI003629F5CB
MYFRSRRFMTVGALTAAAALALSACSGGGSGDSASSGGATDILLWHGYTEADGKVLDKIVAAYNESQDKCVVKSEPLAWTSISEKLLTSLGAGNGPNLVVQGVDTGLGYADQGAFLSQQAFYDDTDTYPSSTAYYDAMASQVTWDGETYGVPMGVTPFAVYYNPKLWKAAGLTDADYPTTIDELIDVAHKLTIDKNDDGTPEQYGMALQDMDAGMLSTMLHSGGGDFITDGKQHIDSPENVETMTQWQKVWQDGVSPTGLDNTAAMELFGSGRAAMIYNGPWEITSADSFGIDVGMFHWPSDWVAGVYNYWYATSMNDTDEEMACSFGFEDFWNSQEQQVVWTESYYPPNRDDIAEDDFAYPIIAELAKASDHSFYYATGISTTVTDITKETDAMTTQIAKGGNVQDLLTSTAAKVDGYLSNE